MSPSHETAPPQQPAANPSSRALMSVRSVYFLLFACANVLMFVSVYYRSIGLSGTQIGILGTVGSLAGVVGPSVWGLLNDRLGKTRLLLAVSLVGAGSAMVAIGRAPSFLWIVPLAAMHQLFYSTLSPLVDGTTLSLLGEQRARYGSLRAWGTVGFTVMSASIGFVFERAGLPALFIVYPLTLLALLAAAMTLPSRPVYVRGALLGGLWPMLRQRQWQVFIGSLFVFALGINGLFSFMSITIKALGGSDSLVGLAWTVAALAEIPVMLLGQQLLRRLGARRMLIIGFLATAVRMVIISLAPTAQWLLLPQALNGFSYAFYWLGAMTYGSELAGPEHQSTQVGLTVATFSLASMVGSAVSGVLFDALGPAGLFRVLAGFALAAFILFTWGTRGERSPRRSS